MSCRTRSIGDGLARCGARVHERSVSHETHESAFYKRPSERAPLVSRPTTSAQPYGDRRSQADALFDMTVAEAFIEKDSTAGRS